MTRRLKELLGDLVSQLKSCTNCEYFQAKRESLIDPVSELDELYVVNRDWTITHVGWAGHMAFRSAKRVGEQELIRVDYEKYLLGEEEYLLSGR